MKTFLSAIVFFLSIPLSSQVLPVDSLWVETTLASMPVEEKVGQLIMPAHQSQATTAEYIRSYHVGSIWFAKAKAPDIILTINSLQSTSHYPLLVAGDFEKGVGTHVDGGIDLPGAMALGASGDPTAVYDAAAITAREARAIGVHLDFAPVVDVNNNPLNPVINIRSFGEDPRNVSRCGLAAVRGYQGNGLLATLKHYPGHGNPSTDSHSDIAVVEGSRSALDSVELRPYREILAHSHPAAVMVSHLWLPAVDSERTPATFSRTIVSGILRGEFGFDGIVCTDAMVMGAIRKHTKAGEAAVKAIQAGADLIVWPESVPEAYESILAAVKSGEISAGRLNESVRRILRAKTMVNLQKERLVDVERGMKSLSTEENRKRAELIAASCITLVKDDRRLLPIDRRSRVLIVTLENQSGAALMSRTLVNFPGEMEKRFGKVSTAALADTTGKMGEESIAEAARTADVVVVAAYARVFMATGKVDLPEAKKRFIERLIAANPNLILVAFGNPYIGAGISGLSSYVCAFDNAAVLQSAAAAALAGESAIGGRLPVTVSASMPRGTGLRRPAQ